MAVSDAFSVWFLDRVKAAAQRYRDERAVLFFLGLSAPMSSLLAGSDLASPSLVALLDDEGHVDYARLEESRRETFRSLMSADEPRAFLYEQLEGIKGSLEELYDGKIVVVRNNLFLDSEGYPCPGSDDELARLARYLEGEVGKAPASARCYGQVALVGGHYLVSPNRFEDELGCEVVDLIEGVDEIYRGEALADPISVPGPQYLSARLGVAHGLVENMSFDLGARTSRSWVPTARRCSSSLASSSTAVRTSAS